MEEVPLNTKGRWIVGQLSLGIGMPMQRLGGFFGPELRRHARSWRNDRSEGIIRLP